LLVVELVVYLQLPLVVAVQVAFLTFQQHLSLFQHRQL
jgi:hypothetical protein